MAKKCTATAELGGVNLMVVMMPGEMRLEEEELIPVPSVSVAIAPFGAVCLVVWSGNRLRRGVGQVDVAIDHSHTAAGTARGCRFGHVPFRSTEWAIGLQAFGLTNFSQLLKALLMQVIAAAELTPDSGLLPKLLKAYRTVTFHGTTLHLAFIILVVIFLLVSIGSRSVGIVEFVPGL